MAVCLRSLATTPGTCNQLAGAVPQISAARLNTRFAGRSDVVVTDAARFHHYWITETQPHIIG
jgi:hypothetical protein